ncbi:MAG TPA: tripartite tricarboxylate transporter substrate binding protein [Burkholderiales bacterium]|nr:tripartite tricarboxylate transporter substrate binding protein [Burkholderiales bacterium]
MIRISAAVLVLAAAALQPAWSQSYPGRPVHVIVPSSPGGAIDVVARLVAPQLAEALGQPFIIENKIGGFGTIGVDIVAKAEPDGLTLLATLDSFASNPWLLKKNVTVHKVDDFAPISLVVRSPQVLVVPPTLGVKTLDQFLRLARAKGEALNYGTAGAGTSSRLSVELFKDLTGIDPTAIHYKGGGPAAVALIAGQVDMMIITLGVAIEHVRAGKLVPIAVTSPRRAPQLPDVPTLAETYPGFETQSWMGLLAPAGTPAAIVDRLSNEIRRALAGGPTTQKLESFGYEVVAGSPAEFGAFIRAESARWERLIRERHIAID